MNKQSEYYSSIRSEVQDRVKKNSKFILDVGCGSGVMGYSLKSQLAAEVWGIEIVESAGLEAIEKLDNVFIGPVEECYEKLPNSYFDTMIFADVLEHLVDPYSLLKNIVGKLKDDGEIVASIPNINYWGVILSLLMGDFRYSDQGILDRTHLRFFTRSSIYEMFADSGLHIIEINAVHGDAAPIPDSFLNACSEMKIDVERLRLESSCFQYVVVAVKKELYQDIFCELTIGNDFLKHNNPESALKKFKLVRKNFRKYNDKELYQLKLKTLDELIEKLENSPGTSFVSAWPG